MRSIFSKKNYTLYLLLLVLILIVFMYRKYLETYFLLNVEHFFLRSKTGNFKKRSLSREKPLCLLGLLTKIVIWKDLFMMRNKWLMLMRMDHQSGSQKQPGICQSIRESQFT
jgi:hypothetical protein